MKIIAGHRPFVQVRRCVLILLATVAGKIALGQQDFIFTTLNSNDGLSSNTITDILKDRYGLMWFATEDGLNKFDGTRFTVYRSHGTDSNSLQSNEIRALHEDRAGNLWIGTSGGSLSLYDRKQNAFRTYPAENLPNSINNSVIFSLCSDSGDRLWIGSYGGINLLEPATGKISKLLTKDGTPFTQPTFCLFRDSRNVMWIGTNAGLYSFNPATNSLNLFRHQPNDKTSLIGDLVKTIVEDKKGRIWIGTSEGISIKTPGSDGFTNLIHVENDANSISKGDINALSTDKGSKLWIGTRSGLDILDIETGKITNVAYDKRTLQGLAGRSVTAIYSDPQGINWLGTLQGGISKFDRNLNLFNLVQSDPFNEKGLPAPTVTSFAQIENGKIYIGTEHGGVTLFDPENKSFRQVELKSRVSAIEEGLLVLCLKYTKNKDLFVGTFGKGLFILNPESGKYRQLTAGDGLGSNHIFSVTEDRNHNIWLGLNGAGIVVLNPQYRIIAKYTPAPALPGERLLPINGYIRAIVEDRHANMWIGTHGGGIAMLDSARRKFSVYHGRNSRLPSDKICSIFEDSRGRIWAGTFGGGLAQFDPARQRFINFSENDGLANNSVSHILEDAHGNLWLSTNQGISCFNTDTKKFFTYSRHNGLQPGSFSRGAGLRAKDGTIYFGGLLGFNYFDPSYLRKNNNVPSVLFTDLRISNESVSPSSDGAITENISIAKEINLDYRQNFALTFVGLNFTAPQQNQYAYKLEGFDKDWNYVGNTNTAVYTNLDPGEYVFRVRASNNDGLWNNEGSAIRISVHPPFWRTPWAYVCYLVAFLGLLMYSRFKGIKRVKKKFQLRQEKLQAEQERREAERIRELDRQKIKFLTNLSHEFRTPISLILGPIDSLVRQEHDAQSSGQLNMIKRNAKRLLNLVNQLLDFRKMEENELHLHPTSGEFVSFVRDLTDSFKDLAERKQIELVFDNRIDGLDTVFDHNKMERILFNLLSNAFKFTLKDGRICVRIEQMEARPDDSRHWVQVSVRDTGTGIPADKQEKIFENFFQDTTVPDILNQGTGIGLSITKEFVKMQGGSIRVKSEPGKGACFIMDLPFEPIVPAYDETLVRNVKNMNDINGLKEKSLTQMTTPVAGHQTEKPAVLLVEDNDDYRYYLKDVLATHYNVHEATNGKEGWQKALAQHPELIVSDISMPYMDGIELCKKIKADKRTNHIPVILLTALTGETDQLRGLEIGANDYITKPFNSDMLNARVKNLLALNHNFRSTYSKQIKVLAPDIAIESEDEKLLGAIMAHLEENLTDTQLSVEGLSRHIGMSRSSLYSKLLELTGQTPVEFIRSVKLDKAAILLGKSSMNIAQVAYSTGFATPNYFSKSFKAKFGMLPSEYVQKMRK